MKMDITIIANAQISHKSMGGSDKIFIELARRWKRRGHNLRVFGCREAASMCRRCGLGDNFREVSQFDTERLGLFLSYTLRTLSSFFKRLPIQNGILYSSSDFFPDLIFAFWQKVLNRRIKWVAGMYLVAPSPFEVSYARSIRGIVYWLTQRLGVILLRMRADFISVLCQEDKVFLVRRGLPEKKVIIISGGVDFDLLEEIPPQDKSYQGCFLGRFHHQKGIPEMIAIWKRVVDAFPLAKLVIAGWGDRYWVDLIKRLIAQHNLQNNISMPGFLDNQEKFRLLKASKVFLFPSTYESWGIVVAEAMACGLPVVAFSIPAMRKFNQGATLIDPDGLDLFAGEIIRLLEDDSYYLKKSSAASEFALSFKWEDSAEAITQAVENRYA